MKSITKKTLITLFVLVLSMVGFSQDVITKKDGSTINAKVTDILDGIVKYKKPDNLEGPTYSIGTDKISKIKYENGSEDSFSEGGEVSESSNSGSSSGSSSGGGSLLDDENFKRQVEAIAKDAGEQVLENCSGIKDNAGTDIYWDGVFKDTQTGDITVPIRAWWNKKWAPDGNKRWVKGKVIVKKTGEKKWVYLSAGGFNSTGCAEKLKLK